jgi:hypothetical protein
MRNPFRRKSEITIDDIKRVRVEPGDVLVVYLSEKVCRDPDTVKRVSEQLHEIFPLKDGARIAIIETGVAYLEAISQ